MCPFLSGRAGKKWALVLANKFGNSQKETSPRSAPVWIGRKGDLLFVCTEAGSLKGRNTQREPRVSLSLVDFVDPYTEVQIRGRAIERRPDHQLKYCDAISLKYIGKASRLRGLLPDDTSAIRN